MAVQRFGLTGQDVIRHYDVTGKICPKYFVEHEDAWEQLRRMCSSRSRRLRHKNKGRKRYKKVPEAVAKQKKHVTIVLRKIKGDNMNLFEAIFVRKSVRSYTNEGISPKVLEDILKQFDEINGLFGGVETELAIFDNRQNDYKMLSSWESRRRTIWCCILRKKTVR